MQSVNADLGKVEGLGRQDMDQDHPVHVRVDLGNLGFSNYVTCDDKAV